MYKVLYNNYINNYFIVWIKKKKLKIYVYYGKKIDNKETRLKRNIFKESCSYDFNKRSTQTLCSHNNYFKFV